jgi:predicted metalloendopeptidase
MSAGWALGASPSSGLDLPGFDASTRVQDDLFLATNGTWMSKTQISADKPEYGGFIQLNDLQFQRLVGSDRAEAVAVAGRTRNCGGFSTKGWIPSAW